MRDARLAADKRAREAAQGQRSAEGGSAQSPPAKQPARSGARGKKTPEQAGGSGRSPSGARNRMETITDAEAADAQRRSAQSQQRGKGKGGKGLGRGGPAGKGDSVYEEPEEESNSNADLENQKATADALRSLQEVSTAPAHTAAQHCTSIDWAPMSGEWSVSSEHGIFIPEGFSSNRPVTDQTLTDRAEHNAHWCKHGECNTLIILASRSQGFVLEESARTIIEQQQQAREERAAASASGAGSSSNEHRRDEPQAPEMNSNNQQQQQAPAQPRPEVKHIMLRQDGENIISQDALTTAVSTELTALELDSTVSSCRVLGKHGPCVVGLTPAAANRILEDGYIDLMLLADDGETVDVEMTATLYDPKARQVDPQQREKARREQRAIFEQRRAQNKLDKDLRTVVLMVDIPPEITVQNDTSNPHAIKWAQNAVNETLRDHLIAVESINYRESETKLGASTGTVMCFILFKTQEAVKQQPWHALKWMIVADRGIPPAKARFRRETREDLGLTMCCFRKECLSKPCSARKQAERAAGVQGSSLFGEHERPPPPEWKLAAERRKREREAEGRAEQERLVKAAQSPSRAVKECPRYIEGRCTRSSRETLMEGRARCQKKHSGWRVHKCASFTVADYVCSWSETECPYSDHIVKDPG
jgi:hypothetical protein